MRISLFLFLSCFSAASFAASPCADRSQASAAKGPEAAIAILKGGQGTVAQIVDGLGRATMDQVSLESYHQKRDTIEIQGVAQNAAEIAKYLEKNEANPWLKKFEILSLSDGIRQGQKVKIFKAKVLFRISQCLTEKTAVKAGKQAPPNTPPHPAKSGKTINDTAQKVGFDITGFNSRIARESTQEQMLQIEALANYRSIAHFLGSLSQFSYPLIIETLSIQSSPDSDLRLKVNMEIRVANTEMFLEMYNEIPPEKIWEFTYSAPPFEFDEEDLETLQDPFSTWLSPADPTAAPLSKFPLKEMTLLAVECGPDGHVNLRDPEGGIYNLKKGARVGPDRELIIGFDCPGVRVKKEYATEGSGTVIVEESTVPMADGVYVLE
jgi:hypothetical protein